MVTQGTIQRRVNRGVALLNARFPGWLTRVNIERLNAGDMLDCPLAQASGERFNPNYVGIGPNDYRKQQNNGFHIDSSNDMASRMVLWPKLTATWKRTIARLRKAG